MNHWQNYHKRWSALGPPQRPNPEAVATLHRLVGRPRGPVLVLGVTPEVAGAFDVVTAVDKNRGMIDGVWPGDTETKRAIEADWLTVDLPAGGFTAVVGDGSLNSVPTLDDARVVLARAFMFLRPGGRFACRVYARPDDPFTEELLIDTLLRPATIGFHAFKWMLAMNVAESEGASVPVARLLERFEELSPDRELTSRRTGWPRTAIDTVDAYRDSPVRYCFPSRTEFLAMIPRGAAGVAFEPSGTYDLAACCPTLTFSKPV
ncbi:MAG: hypothetical protein U1E46_02970 [Hyphomicrobiales bacterium]